MLYLTRKLGQSIMINDKIEVQVVEIKGKTVKLGFVFPEGDTILRKEIVEKVHAENQSATDTRNFDVLGILRGLPSFTKKNNKEE